MCMKLAFYLDVGRIVYVCINGHSITKGHHKVGLISGFENYGKKEETAERWLDKMEVLGGWGPLDLQSPFGRNKTIADVEQLSSLLLLLDTWHWAMMHWLWLFLKYQARGRCPRTGGIPERVSRKHWPSVDRSLQRLTSEGKWDLNWICCEAGREGQSKGRMSVSRSLGEEKLLINMMEREQTWQYSGLSPGSLLRRTRWDVGDWT